MEPQKPQPVGSKSELLTKQINDLFVYSGTVRWEYLPDKQALDIPAIILEHYNYSADETPLPIERWLQIIHPDDQQAVARSFQELVQGKTSSLECTYRIREASGEYRYFHARGGISSSKDNPQNVRISGTLQDVTESELAIRLLNKKDKLIGAVNTSIGILFNDYETGFDRCMNEVLFLLGEAMDIDRCGIWKNITDSDGKSYAELFYEWSPNAEPQQNNSGVNLCNYAEQLPFFQQVLQSGHSINSRVKELPEPERSHLAGKNIASILIVPIQSQDDFLGFIAFENCREERIWDTAECDIMKSIGGVIASVIKRRDIETSLLMEQQTLNWVIESAPNPMIISSDNIICRINKAAKKILGLNIGDSADKIYPPDMKRSEVLKSVQEDGFFSRQSASFICKDNLPRDFMMLVQPFKLFSEKQLILWATDITALKETERKLITAKEKAEDAVKIKSEFLARMSHEIRTPMNAIIGMIYLCLQTKLTDGQKDYLTKATTAANNLLGIINDILDFSKIEANRIELELITFSIRELVNDVSDLISIQINEKNLKFKVRIEDDIEEFLVGDPLRLRQIIINLLSNAVKFTSIGGITVDIIKIPSDNVLDDSITLKFSVKDTGIGIPEKQINSIFDSFVQAEGSTSRKFGGTGLGLAIVKRLVELMGGTICARSKTGSGSEFEFTALFGKATSRPEESSAVLLDRKRVLVVDDDKGSCEILGELIKSMGMIVETVHSGSLALERLMAASRTGQTFDLILVDWRMPRMDGIETIRQIHSHGENIPPLHILMVSAYDRQDCMRLAAGLNVAGVLIKPINPAELKRTLKQVFLQKLGHTNNEKKADIRGAKVLLAEDNKINQMVAEGLLKILNVELTIVNNGKEAVEAVKNNDYDLVLMDVQMPEMDGIEATKHIRSLDKTDIAHLPILAMTANAMDTDYHKSIDAGMNDHLTKPIDPVKLRLALEKWIQR